MMREKLAPTVRLVIAFLIRTLLLDASLHRCTFAQAALESTGLALLRPAYERHNAAERAKNAE